MVSRKLPTHSIEPTKDSKTWANLNSLSSGMLKLVVEAVLDAELIKRLNNKNHS